MAVLRPLHLPSLLEPSTSTMELPLEFHNRTGRILPGYLNQLQQDVNELMQYTESNLLKTKIMSFNFRSSIDYQPQICLEAGTANLEQVESYKLLGIILTSDTRWRFNTDFIVAKAHKRIWILRRLKNLGVSPEYIYILIYINIIYIYIIYYNIY